ncbi:MAG: zinc ribbon domain-containing protein [Nitrospirota bacterium]
MPIYEYRCKKCNHIFDIIQKSTAEKKDVMCPECGGKETEKILSPFSSFDGSSCSPSSFS